jgi:hypothetical protein
VNTCRRSTTGAVLVVTALSASCRWLAKHHHRFYGQRGAMLPRRFRFRVRA